GLGARRRARSEDADPHDARGRDGVQAKEVTMRWVILVALTGSAAHADVCKTDADCGDGKCVKQEDGVKRCENGSVADYCSVHGDVKKCSTVSNYEVVVANGKSEWFPDGEACASSDACVKMAEANSFDKPQQWVCKPAPENLWKIKAK